jgi:hypothetical protein
MTEEIIPESCSIYITCRNVNSVLYGLRLNVWTDAGVFECNRQIDGIRVLLGTVRFVAIVKAGEVHTVHAPFVQNRLQQRFVTTSACMMARRNGTRQLVRWPSQSVDSAKLSCIEAVAKYTSIDKP